MDRSPAKPLAILGAGSWGTALALYLSRRGQAIHLWSIETPHIKTMMVEKTNNHYLPGHPFPDILQPVPDLADAIHGVDQVLVVVPSEGFHATLTAIKPLLKPHTQIICATKGLDASGQLLHNVAKQVLGSQHPYAVLAGTSFAREVATGLPTGVVIASQDAPYGRALHQQFHSPLLQIDLSNDVVGVEICGVAKNVIAIATGIADGMTLGANARSTMITRGLAELTHLGLAIGKGQSIADAEKEIGQAIEGKKNAELIVHMAQQHRIHMPICETVWSILQGKMTAKGETIEHLLAQHPPLSQHAE